MLGGGGGVVSHPLQLTTGLVVNSFVITSPTLAGELMLLIPKVSILSEQTSIYSRVFLKFRSLYCVNICTSWNYSKYKIYTCINRDFCQIFKKKKKISLA